MTQQKSKNALKTIGEAADLIGEDVHTLRTWEKSFSCIRPVRRHSGHRYFRPKDILLLQVVQKLLREHGLSRKGVQKIVRQTSHEKLISTWLQAPKEQQNAASLDKPADVQHSALSPSSLPLIKISDQDEKQTSMVSDSEKSTEMMQEVLSDHENIAVIDADSTDDTTVPQLKGAISKQHHSSKAQFEEILQELLELQQMLDAMKAISKDLSPTSTASSEKPTISGKLNTLFNR